MRILIITDSLGIPRYDVCVDEVWVFRLIEELRHTHQVITHLQPGLSIKDVINLRENLFLLYKPDIVISQLGIVDCSRRALPKEFFKIVSKLPIISRLFNKLAKKYHYQITRLFNFKYIHADEFKLHLESLKNVFEKNNIYIFIIAIAPPGKFLLDTTFAIAEDIELYNNLFQTIENSQVILVNPYKEVDISKMLNIDDGHHLNSDGHNLVYNHIKEAVNVFLKQN